MNILYVSSLCSDTLWSKLFISSSLKSGQAIQKFHKLIVEGLNMQSQCKIHILSAIPVSSSSHGKYFWFKKNEQHDSIKYRYVKFINVSVLKQFLIFFGAFLNICMWHLMNARAKHVIICDILRPTISNAAILASKIFNIKTFAIVTDIPGKMVSDINSPKTIKSRIFNLLISKSIHHFNGYILLTKYMNEIINPHNKPFLIMEGLVDINMKNVENKIENKSQFKTLLYSGGIYEKYGVKKMLEAFMCLKDPCLRLLIYGHGEMKSDMNEYCDLDKRIIYKGSVTNSEVVEAQISATLLINPRPCSLELSKLSFPSKNLEYMVSGTPVVTFPLPGMPKEYLKYVYLFESETVDGIRNTLIEILSLPVNEMHKKGCMAKEFVIENKNNYTQGARILKFIDNL